MRGPDLSRAPLGDAHNFGRRVTMRGGFVHKPRTLAWEWLVLSRRSPLRRALDAAAARRGLEGAFSFLPDLRFRRHASIAGGDVERLSLAPLPGRLSRSRRRALAVIVGRSLALFSWLGVADLHWENLAIGQDARGAIVFTPLDVELVLADLSLPTETKLLPDPDPEYAEVCRHACGVRRALPWLGKPVDPRDLVALARAYRETLELLDDEAPAIAAVLARLPFLRDAPIRVCLRGTGDYVRARSEPVWPPLLDAESEQLARGDIPYFFRLYGRPGLRWFGDRALDTQRCLPRVGDVPRPDPILSIARGLRAPSRRRLREEGLLAVVGAFDHPSLRGRVEDDGAAISFGARRLVVRLPGGEELAAPRDLRALVGSVYLPCRCGEVRAVFVPGVTTCDG